MSLLNPYPQVSRICEQEVRKDVRGRDGGGVQGNNIVQTHKGWYTYELRETLKAHKVNTEKSLNMKRKWVYSSTTNQEAICDLQQLEEGKYIFFPTE